MNNLIGAQEVSSHKMTGKITSRQTDKVTDKVAGKVMDEVSAHRMNLPTELA